MAHSKGEKVAATVRADMAGRRVSKKEGMTQHNFRMGEGDYRRLQDHFDDMGLSMSAGLRMVLKKYMREEGIQRR